MPSSMLTSRSWRRRAPGRARPRARSRSRRLLISLRKRAEPVTLVRSPIIWKLESGRISSGSSPLKRVTGRSRCAAAGIAAAHPPTASAMARMCSGVVPQQPPTMLTSPLVGELAHELARGRRLFVVLAERVGQARVGVARDVHRRDLGELGHVGAHVGRAERAVDAHRERGGVGDRAPEGARPWSVPRACDRWRR